MSFFKSLTSPCEVDIQIKDSNEIKHEKQVHIKDSSEATTGETEKIETINVYTNTEAIQGTITLTPLKAFSYKAIKVALIGELNEYYEGKQTLEFVNSSNTLAGAGKLTDVTTFEFSFKNINKKYESYRGNNFDIRYSIRVTICRSLLNMNEDKEFWVRKIVTHPQVEDKGMSIKVGLPNIVLLKMTYFKMIHDCCKGFIEGCLRFEFVNVRIDRAVITLKRRESSKNPDYPFTHDEVLFQYEIIDGTPYAEEEIPLRIYFDAIPSWKLMPTEETIEDCYGVTYHVHLALWDIKKTRYFKQRELTLIREQP